MEMRLGSVRRIREEGKQKLKSKRSRSKPSPGMGRVKSEFRADKNHAGSEAASCQQPSAIEPPELPQKLDLRQCLSSALVGLMKDSKRIHEEIDEAFAGVPLRPDLA